MSKPVHRGSSKNRRNSRSGLELGCTLDISYKGFGDMSYEVSSPTFIGHEQPFAIQMCHERDAEETDPNIKCQFILRENKKTLKDIERKAQKSKRKKLPIPGIFRKSTGKLSNLPLSPSLTDGKLFGCPLDEICNPHLPKPLMELLDNLYNVGPYTTEIFRKPANARKCHEMVLVMNSSQPEGWAHGCHNGILFASILKTFLKELPGTLCCSKFYNQWVDAIAAKEESEKISLIQSIIDKLPQGNQLLLRHTICILHHIASQSDDNLMTSYNLAVCLGPSLLWSENSDNSEEAAKTSRAVPTIIQHLIDSCKAIFGDDIVDLFGHPPSRPPDSDTEEPERIRTPYNDSLESLSDNDGTIMNSLTQMSPSSCSRDSGLILSDPHDDTADHSDEHSLKQKLIKSKSCDSLNQSDSRNFSSSPRLQAQVSSDSLDCDDEFMELGTPLKGLLLTKSQSGSHLYFENSSSKAKSAGRLKDRLAAISNRYKEGSPSLPEASGYNSSDSDKSEMKSGQKGQLLDFWGEHSLEKSSTNSSLQHASSSSDDALPSKFDKVTIRHIDEPQYLEPSDNGHHVTDYLQQFKQTITSEEVKKKRLQEMIRKKADPLLQNSSQSSSSLPHTPPSHKNNHRYNRRTAPTNSPRISRTNTYSGRSGRQCNATNGMKLGPNKAETHPIMPQQYRPSRPPSYNEACERNEILKSSSISEMERIKQTVNSARAKQLYLESVRKFEQENKRPSNDRAKLRHTSSDMEEPDFSSDTPASRGSALTNLQNNNTIGVVNTSNKKIIFKKAPPVSRAISQEATSMFYQPSTNSCPSSKVTKSSSGSSLASSFYRPTQPPPYKEATTDTPDLIDSLGGESLV